MLVSSDNVVVYLCCNNACAGLVWFGLMLFFSVFLFRRRRKKS